MTQDGNAAYQSALMWIVTGEEVHAQKAIQILDAWAAKLQKIEGPDARLRGGLNGFKLVNAAEIMRSSSSWKSENVAQFKSFLKAVILPQVRNFAPDANGNWDAACIGTLMSIVHNLPKDWIFSAFSIGRNQLPYAALAALAGGNVRVGLEDNLWLGKGVLASNGDLVAAARTTLTSMGARVIGPAETREKLKLRKRT